MFGALVGGLTGLIQMGVGAAQAAKAKKERERIKANRPTAVVPEHAKRALRIQAQAAASGMPGYNEALQRLYQNKAQTMSRIREGARGSADIVNAAASIQGASDDALIDLNVQNAMAKEQNRQNFAQGLNQMAIWEERATDWNEREPYRRDLSEANQMQNTGMQTMFSGLDTLGSSAVTGLGQMGGQGGGAPQVGGADMMANDVSAGMNAGANAVSGMAMNPPASAQMVAPPTMNPWQQSMMPAQGNQYNMINNRGVGFSSGINPFSPAGQMLNINPFQ